MGRPSKAQDELSGTGYGDDEVSISLTELQENETILLRVLSDARIRVEGALNTILQSRVMDLMDIARQNIAPILENLESNKGLSPEELAPIKSLPKSMQLDALMALFKNKIFGKK